MSQKYKCHIHPHPGYDLSDAHTDRYLKEMAISINKSKIALTCSSKFKYRLGKYVEIPMCNTLLCADKPYSNENYDFLIKINNTMSEEEIIQKLEFYLKNSDKCLEKQKKGLEFCKNYTFEDYAEKLFSQLKNLKL